MLFGIDSQMAARARQYLQRMAQQDRQDALTVTVTAPLHEANGGKPTDGTETVDAVAAAVKTLAQADKSRSLMHAISKLHERRQGNGKPVVYIPE